MKNDGYFVDVIVLYATSSYEYANDPADCRKR